MAEIIQIGNETISREEIEKASDEILLILKTKKRTYQMNKSILKYTIEKLDREVQTIIFH